jgi:hypothetical protein
MIQEHPAFGPMEYYDDKWEARVCVPFFAAYNYPDSPDWNLEDLKAGLFDLFIQDKAGVEPTPAQERAFVHFQENQDVICGAVVAALFPVYQREYADDDMRTDGPSKADPERLKGLIRFHALYVLEGMGERGGNAKPETVAKVEEWALLGFAFRSEWDYEHGHGVLFHRDKVVRVGISDAAWEGSGDF